MDILYHYCPVSSFYSIIEKKSIWLSSLLLSNDYKEGEVFFEKIKNKLLSLNDISSERERIAKSLERIKNQYDALAFCLSKKEDMLSQWRGYADNAQGFSIGFNKNELINILKEYENEYAGIRLREVVYDNNENDKVTMRVLKNLKDAVDSKKIFDGQAQPDLSGILINVAVSASVYDVYLLKNKSFVEEDEWRLIYNREIYNKDEENDVKYRLNSNKIIPYCELLFDDHKQCIQKVYLGPKNNTPKHVVEQFLQQNGFRVDVIKSSASYR